MNRTELFAVAAHGAVSLRQDVEEVLGVLDEVAAEALVAGDEVTLPGLLTAARVERPERPGRNPQTGEAITIAASSGVRLSAATALKTQVKGR